LEGKTHYHFVVNPCKFGSYENLEMLTVLKENQYKETIDIKDNAGKTPKDYAKLQKSGVLYKAICGSELKESTPVKSLWPSCSVDFENDATSLMKEAKAKQDE